MHTVLEKTRKKCFSSFVRDSLKTEKLMWREIIKGKGREKERKRKTEIQKYRKREREREREIDRERERERFSVFGTRLICYSYPFLDYK